MRGRCLERSRRPQRTLYSQCFFPRLKTTSLRDRARAYQRKPRCARGGALRALVAPALVAECMHACQTGEIIVICDASLARNHHHLHPQKLLMPRPKASWVCGWMARRLVGAVVPRSVHANLNMGLFLRAVLCSTTPFPAYKIDFRAQKSSFFSRGLRPRTPGKLPLLGRTCLSGFGPVSPQRKKRRESARTSRFTLGTAT